jgi:hypothetical protein
MEKPPINLESLDSEKIYLTLGTIEQIQFLLKKKIKLLYHPTTEEIRQELQYGGMFDDNYIVIWPKERSGTGNILLKGGIRKDKPYAIPTDQFLSIAPGKKVFILFCGYDGIVRDKDKSAAKSIQGGKFVILDLQDQTLRDKNNELDVAQKAFPITLLHKRFQVKEIAPKLSFVMEQDTSSTQYNLVKNLTTVEGALAWGGFSDSEITKHFCIPELKYPLILSKARAWCLQNYLKPFIHDSINGALAERSELQKFALWVYFSSTCWANSTEPGLTIYKNAKELETFYFKPSSKSRQMWTRLINGGSFTPILKKEKQPKYQ